MINAFNIKAYHPASSIFLRQTKYTFSILLYLLRGFRLLSKIVEKKNCRTNNGTDKKYLNKK